MTNKKMVETISEMIINGYIKAEFLEKDSESELENFIKITDMRTGDTVKFHHTVLRLLKDLIKNREL